MDSGAGSRPATVASASPPAMPPAGAP
jgi:hypothetical protein